MNPRGSDPQRGADARVHAGWLAAFVGTAAAVTIFVFLGPQGLARHWLISGGAVVGLMLASWAIGVRINERRR